jgi:hypothetical protein
MTTYDVGPGPGGKC